MTLSIDSFSQTYTEAREKFHAAATAAGLVVQSHRHPLPGRDGEALALDVARLGADDATAVLVLSSGCHGVEGFCGSGVQVALLRDEPFRAAAARAGVAVLFLHALNPWGFSWWRRTTHENVDLNRNWHDFDAALPDNPGYDELADAIVPAAWPPTAADEARLDAYAAAHGLRALQAAITGGQYRHPDGLFYGGQAPTWSQGAVRAALRQHATRCSRLGWIDLHTGLGPSGHGERIFAYRNEAAALERARAWWGADITSIYDGSSSSAQLQGLMWGVVDQACAQARYTGIALEYGTLPLMEVLHALRADQWLANHPGAPAALAAAIKQRTRDAFYTDTPAWKAQVLVQAHEAALQAVAGLS
jgi:Protein of unknown function (DUF2817)